MATLPPIPFKATVVDQNGMITFPWSQWFQQVFARIGGSIAPSNTVITEVQSTTTGQGITLQSLEAEVNALQIQSAGIGVGRTL